MPTAPAHCAGLWTRRIIHTRVTLYHLALCDGMNINTPIWYLESVHSTHSYVRDISCTLVANRVREVHAELRRACRFRIQIRTHTPPVCVQHHKHTIRTHEHVTTPTESVSV